MKRGPDKYSNAGILLMMLTLVLMSFSRAHAEDGTGEKKDPIVQTEASTRADAQVKLEEKAKEAEEALKGKEEDIKQSAVLVETIKEEKKVIEKEAEIKKQEAEIKKQEAEILREEAQTTSDRTLQKKADELMKESRKLEEQYALYQKKISVLENKEGAFQKMLAAQQEQIDAMSRKLSSIKTQQTGSLSFWRKALNTLPEIFIGLVILLFLNLFQRGSNRILMAREGFKERAITLRAMTLIKLITWVGGIITFFYMIFSALEDFGLSVMPLLAGAGIAGLAFGFGGQYLIRDLINGIFILLEDQFRIGDVVSIGGNGGLVEDINLRITTLRDLEGRVTIIPNGEIKSVINFTKGYSQALLDVGVAYKENVDRVMEVIKDIGKEMRADPYFGRLILNDLEMLGVDDFAESAVIIRFRIKTEPIKQWEVMREFRRRLKNRFDELGIEIPFPHRTLYWGKGSGPAESR